MSKRLIASFDITEFVEGNEADYFTLFGISRPKTKLERMALWLLRKRIHYTHVKDLQADEA